MPYGRKLPQPYNNWILFQVLVDGQPMYGQISSDEFFTQMGFPEVAALVQPPQQIVGDPEQGDTNRYRMVSYTFQMPVPQGMHTVTVKWAGCCTATGPDNLNTFAVGRASLLLLCK